MTRAAERKADTYREADSASHSDRSSPGTGEADIHAEGNWWEEPCRRPEDNTAYASRIVRVEQQREGPLCTSHRRNPVWPSLWMVGRAGTRPEEAETAVVDNRVEAEADSHMDSEHL